MDVSGEIKDYSSDAAGLAVRFICHVRDVSVSMNFLSCIHQTAMTGGCI